MATPRSIPADVVTEFDSAHATEHLLIFLVLDHPVLDNPIRVVSDPKDHTYGGDTYTGFMFNIQLLTDDDQPPRAQLSVQNVNREVGSALQLISSPMSASITLIDSTEFNQGVDPRTEIATAAVSYQATNLELVDVDVDGMFVSGRLRVRDYRQEQWPATMGTQDLLPGLFR